MLSVGFRPSAGNPQQANLPKNLIFATIKTPSFSKREFKPIKTNASSSLTTQQASILDDGEAKEKPRIVVKPMERPRLVLRFLWMEKNIGIAIDQVIPGGHGSIPLSPYYFWPRKDAWKELKVMLESKPWISKKQTVVLLNQATDIINLWQQSGES
ncbi:30S ribosomal protein 3, chloroplastic-like [Dorcoceras hygrometricum]|uniref:30S ribosomal protein 3, chloroplastic n=1 Tax=Dorcoceras hygrometricum TaxID=472368 RepID=A0A2Z7APE6_9LAMI|nr:30S ribosomal protein 3, chloroplastic-like [Dorcoceras hygrometricum]